MAAKRALVTGITGQDGSYLAELLLDKGYEVYGVIRRASTFNTHRIDHIYQDPHEKGARLKLLYGDLSDAGFLYSTLSNVQPDEIYNLAAQSHVRVSFDIPEYSGDIDALGAVRILEAMHRLGLKSTRFYQASSSEMFGKVQEVPQTETTPFYPRSPYAVAKLYGHWITKNYRESYGLFACSGILFNHESPRRGETFVTRKITRAVAHIKAGLQDKVYLGNLDAKRISARAIIERTAKHFHVSIDDILGPKRDKDIVVPRQIAMYMLRSELKLSFPKIAHELGRKDHTTAIHSIEKIQREISYDSPIRQYVNELKEKLYA